MRLDPTLYEAPYFYGRTLQSQGKLHEAAKMYERAVAIRPDEYQTLSYLAMAYQSLDDKQKVLKASQRMVKAAERAIMLNPGDSRALYLGAINLERIGDHPRAAEWGDRADAKSRCHIRRLTWPATASNARHGSNQAAISL